MEQRDMSHLLETKDKNVYIGTMSIKKLGTYHTVKWPKEDYFKDAVKADIFMVHEGMLYVVRDKDGSMVDMVLELTTERDWVDQYLKEKKAVWT